MKSGNIRVLMYHRIVKEYCRNTNDVFAVSENSFRNQLKILEFFNFSPITFEDYQLFLEGKLTLPPKPVILTIDDGYLETYTVALPILREFDMRAVFYVIGNRKLKYAEWDQKGNIEPPLMTDDQILEARSIGFEIGAHTMNHLMLPNLSKEAQIEEIIGSKHSLENLIGEDLLSFAYPYGSIDKRSYEIVSNAGFKFACGVNTGPAKFGGDIFNIRRLTVRSKTGLLTYLLNLIMKFEFLEWMKYMLKKKSSDFWWKSHELETTCVD